MNSKLNSILMSFNIDKKIKKDIQKIARRRGISMSALINGKLFDYVEEQKRKTALHRTDK